MNVIGTILTPVVGSDHPNQYREYSVKHHFRRYLAVLAHKSR
ncbi:hypothetical protein [Alicyclobacillus dauci]|uniref:Uncharacterized protein n=1 Tax=Alicyclobacillus dauci TaxID=1475485 RepID=A0ABY6Z1U9_9BACL|nr:hypothetical protein [Alicyclobacillus dauci]WAH36855.1 hypothetical protein NZD86_22245 [Alicyclobacillus dauci]